MLLELPLAVSEVLGCETACSGDSMAFPNNDSIDNEVDVIVVVVVVDAAAVVTLLHETLEFLGALFKLCCIVELLLSGKVL